MEENTSPGARERRRPTGERGSTGLRRAAATILLALGLTAVGSVAIVNAASPEASPSPSASASTTPESSEEPSERPGRQGRDCPEKGSPDSSPESST